jgi:hypothetical protein
MNVVFQGHVATDGSTKIVCTNTSLVINSIIINNLDAAYTFNLSRFMTGPGIHEVPIYEFQLDAGDSIRDLETYTLENGNYLQLISSVPGTTFYISATQT